MNTFDLLTIRPKSNFVDGFFLITPEQKKFISQEARERGKSQNQIVRDIFDGAIKNTFDFIAMFGQEAYEKQQKKQNDK